MTAISPAELERRLGDGGEHALFDVREAGEAERGQIDGATFLPRRSIELRIRDLVPKRSTTLFLYDDGGPRALLAARRLAAFGYSDVHVLAGGAGGWQAAGYKLTSGSNVPSKRFGEEVAEHQRDPDVDADTLEHWRQQGRNVLVCDIRTPEEYRGKRIPGAVSTPGFDVALCAADLAHRNATLVVNCAGRTRSIIACETLRQLGLSDVYALRNGTMGWVLGQRHLEEGAGAGAVIATPESREQARQRASDLALGAGAQFVTASELAAWLGARAAGELNLYVLDVRQVPEYEAGHIAGSAILPGALAVQRTDEFVPVRAGRVVFVDDDEARALVAAYWFRRMGIGDVHVLRGGIASWPAPLATGRRREEPLRLAEAKRRVPGIEPTELRRRLAGTDKPLVVDVGTSRDFVAGHIPGAKWIPRGWLEVRIGDAAPDRETPIVVTCRDQIQSSFAAEALLDLGYDNVLVLIGGTRAYGPADLETGSTVPPEQMDDIVVQPYAKGLDAMRSYLDWEVALTRGAAPDAATAPTVKGE